MGREEIVLAWHSLTFRLQCAERTGIEFQSFFEQIMEKLDPSFVKVKPSGKEGDWKCDGWLPGSGTCFQVYAPEELTVSETVAKIKADFAGAAAEWGGQMKRRVFVWSAREKGIPAAVLSCLNDLVTENEEIEVDQWGRERLWSQVRTLPEGDRIDLFGVVPIPAEITATTDHEVQVLLTYIADQPIPDLDGDLELVGLEQKMDRNEFDDGVRILVKAAMPIVPTVQHYVSNHPDQRFSQRVAVSLAERYRELSGELDGDPNAPRRVDLLAALGHERWQGAGAGGHPPPAPRPPLRLRPSRVRAALATGRRRGHGSMVRELGLLGLPPTLERSHPPKTLDSRGDRPIGSMLRLLSANADEPPSTSRRRAGFPQWPRGTHIDPTTGSGRSGRRVSAPAAA